MSKNLYQRGEIWWARFKVRGVCYRRSLLTRSRAVAEKRLKALRQSIEDEAVFGIAGPVSWPDAVVAWHETIAADIGAKTIKRYQVSLRTLRPFLDHLSVQQVNGDALRDMVKARKRHGVTNATIRRDLTAISSVLNHACDLGWTERNAAAEINRKRLAPERTHRIALPADASIAAMRAAVPKRWRDLIDFARRRGMRADEIVSLRHDAIDRKAMTITIARGKGNRTRVVPIDRADVALIDRQPRHIRSPFVFWEDDGDPISNLSSRWGGYQRRVAQKVAQSGVEFVRFRFHDLRHLFAVEYLRARRGSIYDLQGELGHESITTTERYLAFLTPDEQRAAKQAGAQKRPQVPRSKGKSA